MKILTKIVCLVLTVTFSLSCLQIQAHADFEGFNEDWETVKNNFAAEYGWNTNYIDKDKWYSESGEEVERTSGNQLEYYRDLAQIAENHCIELGILSASGDFASGGQKMVDVARAEIGTHEIPCGTNSVKYNDWFYGYSVCDKDTNRDGKFTAADDIWGTKPNKYGFPPGQYWFPWCCTFVTWVAGQCGYIDSGQFIAECGCSRLNDYLVGTKGYKTYGTSEIVTFAPEGDKSAYQPVPGDIIFYNRGHVGIVAEADTEKIVTIEGNVGGQHCGSGEVCEVTHFRANDSNYGWIVHVEYPSGPETIFYYLVNVMDFPGSVAAGILANIEHESNFRPHAIGDGGTSIGICQWHDSRMYDLMQHCDEAGLDYWSMEGQLDFLKAELENKFPSMCERFRKYDNSLGAAQQAAMDWCIEFEKPADLMGQAHARASSAEKFYVAFAENMATPDKPSVDIKT